MKKIRPIFIGLLLMTICLSFAVQSKFVQFDVPLDITRWDWVSTLSQMIVMPIPSFDDFDSSMPGETVLVEPQIVNNEPLSPMWNIVHYLDRLLPLIFLGFTTVLGFGWTVLRNRRQ